MGGEEMLHPIAGYTTTQSANGAQFKHIVYVGKDGHLHGLAAPLNQAAVNQMPNSQLGIWQYNLDITAAAIKTFNARGGLAAGLTPIPNVIGYVGVMVTGQGLPQIFYYGDDQDYGPQIHVTFPVGPGYFVPGSPGVPPDGDPDPGDYGSGWDSYLSNPPQPPPDGPSDFGDGPDPGGEAGWVTLASPAGWADYWINDLQNEQVTLNYPGPPLALYNDPDGTINVVFVNSILHLCVIKGNTNGWSDPIDLSATAGVSPSEVFGDASAMFWESDSTEHVFSIYGVGANDETGLVKELWSYSNTSTWGAHDVLHQVKSVVGSSPHSPLAPPANVGSVPAAFDDGAKNVAYIDANGAVYLCSHPFKGEWTISYISEIAQAPPTAFGSAPSISGPWNLLAYASDRQHVLLLGGAGGEIVDLWDDGSAWHWGLPIRIAGDPLGAGQLANGATGISAFVTPDNVDHIVYIGGPTSADLGSFIWELQYVQGQPEVPNDPNDPNFGQKGLPWVAVNASMQAGGGINLNSWSNPNYVPPTNSAKTG
jgi:hypothetical protein